MFEAVVIASLIASALDLALHYWRTPLGWSPTMIIGVFVISAVLGFVISTAVCVAIGMPIARFLAGQGRLQPIILVIVGILLGCVASIVASAFGNTYAFISGPGFWQSFAIDGANGGLAGFFWSVFEKARLPSETPTSHA